MMIGKLARTTRAVIGVSPPARFGSQLAKSIVIAPATTAVSARKPASHAIGNRRGETTAGVAEGNSLGKDDIGRLWEEFELVGVGVGCVEVVIGGESTFIELQGFGI